jgi:hypothetical protein
MILLLALQSALAQDDAGLSLTPSSDIDLTDPSLAALTYEGGLSGNAPNYGKGKPVVITHASGNVSVRCINVDALSGRLQYTVFGSQEGPMESYGKGIGLAVWGDSNGGGAKSRIPSKPSGVARAQVDLVVNIPKGTSSLTVSQTGSGWVQVNDCGGNVKVTAGSGGAYVSGALTGFNVTATGGDVKIEPTSDTVLKSTSSASAPGGNLTVVLPSAQGGKLSAKGSEVAVQQTVMGTNTPTLVQGDMGLAGPTISLSAKSRVEVNQP